MGMGPIDVTTKYPTFDITTARNTNALNTVVTLGDFIVKSVDILFAPGHVGLTGVRLVYAGTTILPWNQPTKFVVGDSERLHYALGIYMPGPLTIVTHNGDGQASHRHILTFECNERPTPGLIIPDAPLPQLIV